MTPQSSQMTQFEHFRPFCDTYMTVRVTFSGLRVTVHVTLHLEHGGHTEPFR